MTNEEWTETEEAFHETMTDLYRKQVLETIQNRDAYPGRDSWKNRTLISAKLNHETYAALMAYCRDREFSVNTALRTILSSYFTTPND